MRCVTLIHTSRLRYRLGVMMPFSCRLIAGIGMTTGASVCGVATRSTSGGSDGLSIIVSPGCRLMIRICITAGAGVRCVTLFGTGCCCDGLGIRMCMRRCLRGFRFAGRNVCVYRIFALGVLHCCPTIPTERNCCRNTFTTVPTIFVRLLFFTPASHHRQQQDNDQQ